MSTLLAVGRLANVSLLVCTCYVDKVLVKNKTKKKHAGEKIECYVKLKIFMYGHLCMDIYVWIFIYKNNQYKNTIQMV